MIAAWATIGVIVGLLLGLTGAGGAIVAIPLFVWLAHATLHEATVLSLLTVAIGATFNGWVQRRGAALTTALLLFVFSLPASYAVKPLKAMAPEWVIVVLFTAVGLVSLRTLWTRSIHASAVARSTRDRGAHESLARLLIRHALGGAAVGALVTMTGLGGGVLLVPLLTGPFQLPLSQATATSLLAIVLTSIASLALQWQEIAGTVKPDTLTALAMGSLCSAGLIRTVIARYPSERIDPVRRMILTVVVLISGLSLVLSIS